MPLKRYLSTLSIPLIVTVFVTLAFGVTTYSYAQYEDLPKRERFLPKLDERQERRGEIKERIATKQAALRLEHIQKLKEVFDRILGRYGAALTRLDKIVNKIERRIEKLQVRGVDTSRAQSQLAVCSSKKAAAETAIVDARSKVAAIDPASATVRETLETSVEAFHGAKKAIGNYHKCLVDVTRSLRASKMKEGTSSAQ